MLLDDDVVADGEARPSSLAGRLRREKGIKHLFFYPGRNADAIIAYEIPQGRCMLPLRRVHDGALL